MFKKSIKGTLIEVQLADENLSQQIFYFYCSLNPKICVVIRKPFFFTMHDAGLEKYILKLSVFLLKYTIKKGNLKTSGYFSL